MSLINIGLTGLKAHQTALNTTGNNITNANTPGYSRQQVDFSANASQVSSVGFQGSGVSVDQIRRINDEFLNGQLRSDTTLHGEQSAFLDGMKELDDLLANNNTGLNAAMTDFFGAVQSAAEDPSNVTLRQQVIRQGESLVQRFTSLDNQLQEKERTADQKMEAEITNINALASSIADLNQSIAAAPGRAQGAEANELLDRREEKLRELSELVQVSTTENDNGTVDVRIGKGQELVSGAKASELRLSGGNEQVGRREILLSKGSNDKVITGDIQGGKLGGLVKFRDEVLEPTINSVGQIALGIGESFNNLHQAGLNLDGDLGGLFFRDINDDALMARRITPNPDNVAPDDRVASVRISDATELDNRSLQLDFSGPTDRDYEIRDALTGETLDSGRISEELPARITLPGMQINLESGSFQEGDSFQIRPTFNGADDLSMALSRPEDLALASPIRAETGDGNRGTGTINQGEVLDIRDPVSGRPLQTINEDGELEPPLMVRFISENRFEVLDATDPSDPQPLDPPMNNERFVAGNTNSVFSSDPGARKVTTQGDALGVIGDNGDNGFEGQTVTVTTRDPDTGRVTREEVDIADNASAREIATALSNERGVNATAYTEVRLDEFDGEDADVTLTVNGEAITLNVPGELDADSLDAAIRNNDDFAALGITAVSDGESLRLRSDTGEDISVALGGVDVEMDVNKINPYDRSVAATESLEAGEDATVGGVIDVTLSDGVRINADNNNIFRQAPSSASAYTGIQFELGGRPEAGDRFHIESNTGGTSDNRNGLKLGNLSNSVKIDGGDKSFEDAYSQMVGDIGSQTKTAQVDEEAARTLKQQSQNRWESKSGVNLDEEAGKLIEFQAAYNASAQVVSISRDLFDTLLGTFR